MDSVQVKTKTDLATYSSLKRNVHLVLAVKSAFFSFQIAGSEG